MSAIDLAPVQVGSARALFLAVGGHDNTVRVLSLSPDSELQQVAMQFTEAAYASSLLFMDTEATTQAGLDNMTASLGNGPLFLQIGLSSGVLMRVEVDRVTGQLKDARWRFLGLAAPKLIPVIIRGRRAMVALSKRPWLGYFEMGK